MRNLKIVFTIIPITIITRSCGGFGEWGWNISELYGLKIKETSKLIYENIYGQKLINSDFLKYAENSKIDSLETHLKNSFDIYDVDNFKVVHIDAEELAEFSFDFFLPQLNRILKKRNMNLTVKTANDYENTNDIIINGEKINLYTKKELDNQTFWNTAPRNFFKKVNELLKAKNSNEQFYLLYDGNDLHTLLLTDEQFSIISEYYKDNDKAKPYKP